jgi:hypothetical protein
MGGKPRHQYNYVIFSQEDFDKIKEATKAAGIADSMPDVFLWPVDLPRKLDPRRNYRMYEV